MIVAEEITGRFLNVINLFNQAIPLIAIQISALEVNEVITLHATKVLDVALPAREEEDEPGQETDRSYWQERSGAQVMTMADKLLSMVNFDGASLAWKYNRRYIGLQRDRVADNFITLRPRRQHLRCEFRIEQTEELDARLEEAGITAMPYDKRRHRYRLQLTPDDVEVHRELLMELIRLSRGIPATDNDFSSVATTQ